MKFHAVHGSNVTIDENGSRATRTSSFCDAIAFSHKPLALNARVSLLLGANEDWTGALRLGATTQDPATFVNKKLPRYACPDLSSKPGFWARPLPEAWATNGSKLTFYVNAKGQLHVFVNSEHKGAILIGIPVKEQLWILLDLYGTTVSAKFISNSGSAPAEVIARGPEAIQAYQHALTSGSTSYYHTRIALIGPSDGKKNVLKKLLIQSSEEPEGECNGIDTTSVCQASDSSSGLPWSDTKFKKPEESEVDDSMENEEDATQENSESSPLDIAQVSYSEEEFFKAIAVNIVREMILQRKRSKDDRKKTPGNKSAFKLQSSLNKIGSSKGKPEDLVAAKDYKNLLSSNEELPRDLPSRVVELVETMLKESESKQFWEKKEKEKHHLENVQLTFNIWNYSGHLKYLFLHQLFLSPQTIYLFVFDLAQDLEAPIESVDDFRLEFPPDYNLTYLSILHIWLEMIYVTIAHPKDEPKRQMPENQINDIICTLFPPVLIVGVQEDSTTFDSLVEHQFNKIKESIQDKIYYHLVYPTFYYVGSPETVAVDSMISELRNKIQELSIQLPHVGTEIPLKWMLFEQAVERLIEREVYFADTDKLSEVARLENIDTDEEFYSMIHFFHHQGKIWHMGSDMLHGKEEGCGVVILKPQWFINYIYHLMNSNAYQLLKEKSDPSDMEELEDILTSKNFEGLWPNSFHHTTVLLDILDTADALCEVMPLETSDTAQSPSLRTFMIPWLHEAKAVPKETDYQGLVLILDFSNLLPVGFFTKLIVRLFRWSKRHNWKRNLNQIVSKDMIPVDFNHCIKLRKTVGHRIQVILSQRKYVDSDKGIEFSFPAPHVCMKVRHLLERETEHLRDVWFKRISFSINIPCPCEKTCNLHGVSRCTDPQCVHLLSLDDCLTKKVIECDYRLLKTDFIQNFFNPTIGDSPQYSSMRLSMDSISTPFLGNFFCSEHDISGDEPHWLKHVGNALTTISAGQDWIALAKRLGYSEREIRRFSEETFPAISLLNDWINSNGRTRFCIDMLITCLEQMGRKDVINSILIELGPELPSPPVFISYQWESQQAVLHIRKRIELAGYPCWMDVGHIVGGDALYGKIYEGINKAKVVLCFLTPRYVLSPLCSREMSLADILRKPIVPIMLEPTPWPPPGALALILSSLVYIDLCGIGGHGGSGRQADWETRFHSIIERLSHFISPSFSSPLTTISSSERLIPPPITAAVIRNPEEFVETPEQIDERDIINPDVPLPEEDALSEGISTEEPNSPSVWIAHRRNRVTRCSICNIL